MSTATRIPTDEQPVCSDPYDATDSTEKPNRAWQSLLKYGGSLFDQSLVSGTRFLTSILVGSICGATELGIYALGFSVVLIILCVQMSLISRPYAIFGNQVDDVERRQLGGSIFVQLGGFSLLTSLFLGVVLAANMKFGWQPSWTPILAVLAASMPFILWREHARQYCFASLNVKDAVVLDTAYAVIQVAGLGILTWQGELSAVTALLVTGIACGGAGVVWYWACHSSFQVCWNRVWPDFREQWRVGKWDCATEVTFNCQIHGLSWFLALMLDAASVGIYSACMMCIQVMNPFLLGLNSLLVPRTARAYSEEGVSGLQSKVRWTTLCLGGATGAFAIVATIWGPAVLEYIYRAQAFEIPTLVVAALTFGVFIEICGTGPENGLWAMERHDLNFRAEILAAVVSVLSVWYLICAFGLVGAALSFLVGRSLTSAAHWIAYRYALKSQAV